MRQTTKTTPCGIPLQNFPVYLHKRLLALTSPLRKITRLENTLITHYNLCAREPLQLYHSNRVTEDTILTYTTLTTQQLATNLAEAIDQFLIHKSKKRDTYKGTSLEELISPSHMDYDFIITLGASLNDRKTMEQL